MTWTERNQRWLVGAIASLRARIEACGAEGTRAHSVFTDCIDDAGEEITPALMHCARAFGLSPFERELLLLVAALDLDHGLRTSVRAVNGGNAQVTFAFALGALTQPHWDALSLDAPLRRWKLIEPEAGWPLAQALLRIDERVLHFIAGADSSDARLSAFARRITCSLEHADYVSDTVLRGVIESLVDNTGRSRVVMLHNDPWDSTALRDVALAAAARLATSLLWISARDLPAASSELNELAVRLDREVLLSRPLAVLNVESAEDEYLAAKFAALVTTPLLWLGQPTDRIAAAPRERRVVRIEIPAVDEEYLTAIHANGAAHDVQRVARQFRLNRAAIDEIIELAGTTDGTQRPRTLWSAAREAARGGLDSLAQRIVTNAAFDDLVLPPAQLTPLRDIARHLRHRDRVYREWGFGEKHTRGQGLTALFAGESGTGKTLAAEAIANEVELDLYRVDLATVVSKYIGETEKNLKRLFDAAESSGAVLLFDEADALFGKRSEVKDSHDRYANIEVAYLLQRIEAYRGLAILATNMKAALDRAFLRRIRFVIHFPFPDASAREQIWRRQFPARAPLGAVDFASLASLNLSGGHINSIALSAAFNAADRGVCIDHHALIHAARAEFAKLERTFVAPQMTT